jgi:hypothetical protein
MSHKLFFLFVLVLTVSCSGQTDKYDFDETKNKFSTPEELVRSFIQSLASFDSTKVLEHCLTKETALYLLNQMSRVNTDTHSLNMAKEEMQSKFDEGLKQYVLGAKNLRWHMIQDSIDLKAVKIVNIKYEIGDWYKLKPNVMFTSAEIEISNNGKTYFMILPQLIQMKGKWIIGGPEFIWKGISVPIDISSEEEEKKLESVEKEIFKSLEELKKQ